MTKGFTKQLSVNKNPLLVDDELPIAHDDVIAKLKLTLILRSNIYPYEQLKISDLLRIFIQDGQAERGSWTASRMVLSIYFDTGSITVPGSVGKKVSIATEDFREEP